jgi:cytochrome P450
MKRRYPDGPKVNLALAILGQLFPSRFPFDALAFCVDLAHRYGDIAYYRLGIRVYQVNHPDLVRQVLIDDAQKYYKPKIVKRALRPIAGEGLLTSDGDLWKRQRKLMQPVFRHDLLGAYGDTMVAAAVELVDSFRDGEVRDMGVEMANVTLKVVVRTLFGEDLPPDVGDIGDLLVAALDAANERMNNVVRPPAWAPTRRNLRERRAIRKIEEILRELIRMRRESGKARKDLLSVLLTAADADTGEAMSDRQLRDEMMTLFGAGQETTATVLTWTWYLLARQQGVAAKLRDELDRVLGGRLPAAADLPKLPYTEMVIREAMRLYPPAPAVAREPIEDVRLGGYDVPKGSLVTVSVYALHHDERFFADPERFDPERFAAGWEERIPRGAYVPFGGGPRVCIGNGFAMMEARLVLATVAQACILSPAGDQEIQPKLMVTPRPNGPIRMRIAKGRAAGV